MPHPDTAPPRHHLLIAGTGRAGTSSLVRWLAGMGLETHLATHDTPEWNEDANAGLEDLPVVHDARTAPYVMKSPWLVEVIDQVLADPRFVLDGVIIPVRDLEEAASSRIVQELHTAHRLHPWMSGLDRSFGLWGQTPGGVVFSFDPVDQARLLAVTFHQLLLRLVQADIPVVLLDFPRLAQDADYLFGKLRAFLPAEANPGRARAVLAEVMRPEKIRVGEELETIRTDARRGVLDMLALRREVRRLGDALVDAQRQMAAQQEENAALRAALDARAAGAATSESR